MNYEQSIGALYYPYIHIRNPNWLKANLLMFPHIERMIPIQYLPEDDDIVQEFTRPYGDKKPLLRPADLWSNRAIQAQKVLAGKLKEDSHNWKFMEKYGMSAMQDGKATDDLYGFQIHIEKLSEELKQVLQNRRLGWKPQTKEPYDRYGQYVEVNPNVGQAIMATLAIACAEAEGLDIVGDERSGSLHQCLLEKKLDSVYDAWLSVDTINIARPTPAKGEELMEFILGLPSDNFSLAQLTPERIYELTEEREQINNLMAELRKRAASIRAVDSLKIMEESYKDAANDIMKKWQNDRANFANFGRAFFGQDTTKLATSFANTVADKTLTGLTAGTITKATLAAKGAGWLGTLASGGIIGAGAGLIIGLIVHAGTTYRKQKQTEEKSPYKFLTTLESAGILFRSEVAA